MLMFYTTTRFIGNKNQMAVFKVASLGRAINSSIDVMNREAIHVQGLSHSQSTVVAAFQTKKILSHKFNSHLMVFLHIQVRSTPTSLQWRMLVIVMIINVNGAVQVRVPLNRTLQAWCWIYADIFQYCNGIAVNLSVVQQQMVEIFQIISLFVWQCKESIGLSVHYDVWIRLIHIQLWFSRG